MKKKTTPAILSFHLAMKAIASGAQVTKREWGDERIRVYMAEGKLVIQKEDGVLYPLIVTSGDVHGKDWYVVK